MELHISSPCPKRWEDLVGDDRIRYCGQCRLNVYNFAVMGQEEIERVVRRTEGRLCGRLYLRGDRTATSKNCPASRTRTLLKRAIAVAAVLLVGGFAWVCRTSEPPSRVGLPPWLRSTLDLLDPQPAPRALLGDVACPPRPPAAPPTVGP